MSENTGPSRYVLDELIWNSYDNELMNCFDNYYFNIVLKLIWYFYLIILFLWFYGWQQRFFPFENGVQGATSIALYKPLPCGI